MAISSLRCHKENIKTLKTGNGFWRKCINSTTACRCLTTLFISVEHKIRFQWHRFVISTLLSQDYSNMSSIMWYVSNIPVLFYTSCSPFPHNTQVFVFIRSSYFAFSCYRHLVKGFHLPRLVWKDPMNSPIPQEMYVWASKGNIETHGYY